MVVLVLAVGAFLFLRGSSGEVGTVGGGFMPKMDYSGTESAGAKIGDATDSNVFDDTKLNPFDE